MNEQWKKIEGLPDRFEISDLGRVRTLEYTYDHGSRGGGSTPRTRPERVLKQFTNQARGGYAQVTLTFTLNGSTKTVSGKVHQLVAKAFLRPRRVDEEINHINSNKLDNRPANLEWVTRSGNILHSYKSGLRKTHKLKTAIVGTNGTDIVEFESLLAAQKSGRFTMASIQKCLAGQASHHKGFVWTRKELY